MNQNPLDFEFFKLNCNPNSYLPCAMDNAGISDPTPDPDPPVSTPEPEPAKGAATEGEGEPTESESVSEQEDEAPTPAHAENADPIEPERPGPSSSRSRFLRWFKRSPKIKPPPVVSKNRRLLVDYKTIKENPLDHVYIEPLPSNILEWHYVLRGPIGTPYEGGLYHGRLEFPQDFPFHPPAIFMITPNGRFRPNFRLCLSISDYHPDTWDPTWSCGTIIEGILSFMVEKTNTLGAITSTLDEKRLYAFASYEFNLQDKVFCELFPDLVEEMKTELPNRAEEVATRRKELEDQNQTPLSAFMARYRAFMRRTFQPTRKVKD